MMAGTTFPPYSPSTKQRGTNGADTQATGRVNPQSQKGVGQEPEEGQTAHEEAPEPPMNQSDLLRRLNRLQMAVVQFQELEEKMQQVGGASESLQQMFDPFYAWVTLQNEKLIEDWQSLKKGGDPEKTPA